jgi:hypothetical protein
MLQLFPNSQALSMSSAKTIADILSYSQLIDTKASLGNPFTSQPIYIAACAFLKETAEQTATSKEHSRSQSAANSRAGSPIGGQATPGLAEMANMSRPSSILPNSTRPPMVERALARHTLLATAANQHYQLCYKVHSYSIGSKVQRCWGPFAVHGRRRRKSFRAARAKTCIHSTRMAKEESLKPMVTECVDAEFIHASQISSSGWRPEPT